MILLARLHLSAAAQTAAMADPQKTYTEAEAWRIGWPMLHGPCGNFLPLRTGTPIVDDLLQARLLWVSEENDFGSAKTGSKTFATAADVTARLGPDAVVRPGNWAGVIVADGRVFGASFRPAGKVYEGTVKGSEAKARFRLDAEDLLIALDAKTGKLWWKAVEPGGLVLSGGKRGGFQVAPAYYQGKVFSMGSTGRLFAYDAKTGRKLWQGDIGPAHAAVTKMREKILAAAENGRWTDPDGPGWHTSLIVADGVLVVPTFRGSGYSRDGGLRGLDPQTGELKWEVADAVSKWATPSVWRHGDREYILCATLGGVLHLIDPRDGKELWKVTGLGPNYFTLAPSATHVLVNVAPIDDPKAKRVPGYYGAYRITPRGAERAWSMPQEPQNQIPTWFDSCARQRYAIRDGRVYVAPEGTKEDGSRFLLLKETTGEILAEHPNRGDETNRIGGLFYLIEDRLLCRENSCHGATHGGRHPIVQWTVAPGKIARMDNGSGLCGFDRVDFTTAYEVYMEAPVVAGRMFERTADGRLACYDFRRPETAETWSLKLLGGYIGLGALPVTLWTRPDGSLAGGKAFPPTDRQVGLIYGQARRFPAWEPVSSSDAKGTSHGLSGTLEIAFGTHAWPVQISSKREGNEVAGEWTRQIAGLDKPVDTEGKLTGRGPADERLFPTPWFEDKPWTSFGRNASGTVSYVLQLEQAVTLGRKPAGLTICLDHDGKRFVRCAAAAFGFSQSWHEVDASGLKLDGDRVHGHVMLVLNGDWWTSPNPAAKRGIAARIEINATSAEHALSGTYKAQFGVPWTATGPVAGSVAKGK
jgi:outer membrane protein assembly factor BamB